MAHRPAHDPAKDIAPPLVRRISDDAVARLALALRGGAGQLAARFDQSLEYVDVVIAAAALKHGRHPL
jgi:hypothetical protein